MPIGSQTEAEALLDLASMRQKVIRAFAQACDLIVPNAGRDIGVWSFWWSGMAAARRANPARSNKVNPSASRRSYSSCSNAKNSPDREAGAPPGDGRQRAENDSVRMRECLLECTRRTADASGRSAFSGLGIHGLHWGRIATSRLRSAINRRSQDRSRRHIS